jgi:nucleoside-diphosphate-sugar epimerase
MGGLRILVSGVTGFIGRNLVARLQGHGCQLTALVRPNTDPSRLGESYRTVRLLEADLSDPEGLENLLAGQAWDVIVHLGAIRGARSLSKTAYIRVNVDATETLGKHAQRTGAKLIFCSSVGVYGTVPRTLPATTDSPFQPDTIYHYTKIEAEKRLKGLMGQGLMCVILRPCITYGTGDYGFPYMLVKLIDHGFFILPTEPVQIHLVDVGMLCDVFVAAATRPVDSDAVFNVADGSPVALDSLVDVVSRELGHGPYPRWKRLPGALFRLGEVTANFVNSDLWRTRFQLLGKSWYYDTGSTRIFGVPLRETIPNFRKVVTWYKSLRG